MGVNVYDRMKEVKVSEHKKTYRFGVVGDDQDRFFVPNVCFGLTRKGDELVSRFGIEKVTQFPATSPIKSYFYGDFFVYGGGKLYLLTSLGFVYLRTFENAPSSTLITNEEGKKVVLFYDRTDWYVYGETGRSVEGFGRLVSMHYERLFAWDGEKLNFSAPLSPFDTERSIQKGGFITLPSDFGEVLAMVSFGERLHLIREGGVTQFRAFGDNRNFKAVEVGFPCKHIVPSTIAKVGESVFFVADGGIYRYDGNITLMRKIDVQAVEGTATNGNYLVSGKQRGENILLLYEVQENRTTAFALNAKALSEGGFAVGDRWLKIVEGVGEEPLLRVWDSGLSLFGSSSARKMLRKLSIEGRGDVSVEIYSERGKRGYSATLPDLFDTTIRARRFGIRIVAHGKVEMDWMEVKFRDD